MIPRVLALFLCLLPSLALCGDLTYDLSFRIFPAKGAWELRGTATVTGRAPGDLEKLVFRFYQGTGSPFAVASVRDGEEEVPWYVIDPTTLAVFLPVGAGQTFSVKLDYSAVVPPFPAEGYGTFAASDDAVVIAQGYPMLAPWEEGRGWVVEPVYTWGDRVVAEVADFCAEIVFPRDWELVATGTEEAFGEGGVRVCGENLREFAFVLMRGYHRSAGDCSGIEVRSFYPPEYAAAGARALTLSQEAMDCYRETLGEYPFPGLDVVAVPLHRAAGVEYPGLILASLDYYRRFTAGRRELIFPMIFAHEVAHQWWYAQVGNDQVREPWVDEALATYTSGLAMAEWGLYGELRAYWERTYELGRKQNPAASVFDPLWNFPEGAGYGGIVYSGGALFFSELEEAMGREALLSALRRYLEEFRWRLATGEALLSIIREEGGEAAEEVIRRWVPSPREVVHSPPGS